MILFEGHFQQRDGENEYTAKHWVCAPNTTLACLHFQKQLEEWFGEETKVVERYKDGAVKTVTNKEGFPYVRCDWVAAVVVTAVEGTDGKMYHIMHEVVVEN